MSWALGIAAFSAVAATGSTLWNIIWSTRQARRIALARLAEREFKWIDDFRSKVSEISVLGNTVHASGPKPQTPESMKAIEQCLREIGYVDLMFDDPNERGVQEFAKALSDFRSEMAKLPEQGQLGQKNTELRQTANIVMRNRAMRARDYLAGRMEP